MDCALCSNNSSLQFAQHEKVNELEPHFRLWFAFCLLSFPSMRNHWLLGVRVCSLLPMNPCGIAFFCGPACSSFCFHRKKSVTRMNLCYSFTASFSLIPLSANLKDFHFIYSDIYSTKPLQEVTVWKLLLFSTYLTRQAHTVEYRHIQIIMNVKTLDTFTSGPQTLQPIHWTQARSLVCSNMRLWYNRFQECTSWWLGLTHTRIHSH